MSLDQFAEQVDQLLLTDLDLRGVARDLYAAARNLQGSPLCMLAAQQLAERVKPNDVVLLCTGFASPPWFIGEQDGPVGAATLARGLCLGLDATPIVLTEPMNVGITAPSVRAAGLNLFEPERARRLPRSASVLPFPIDREEAQQAAQQIIDELQPKALIAIERPSMNAQGEHMGMTGINLSEHVAKLDYLFFEAAERGILTIGIGDGGNELGCGKIHDAVRERIPHGEKVASNVATDILVISSISNWGAYGIEACLAALTGKPAALHPRDVDERVHIACAQAGAINAGPGLLDPGTDNVPARIHGHILDILALLAARSASAGQAYRYSWL